jgi:hypothetical protein
MPFVIFEGLKNKSNNILMYIPNFVTQGTFAPFLWGGHDAVEMRTNRILFGILRMLTEL